MDTIIIINFLVLIAVFFNINTDSCFQLRLPKPNFVLLILLLLE